MNVGWPIMDEIENIIPPPLPFSLDAKIFKSHNEETGEVIGDPYSYNEWVEQLKNISGISEDLMGK